MHDRIKFIGRAHAAFILTYLLIIACVSSVFAQDKEERKAANEIEDISAHLRALDKESVIARQAYEALKTEFVYAAKNYEERITSLEAENSAYKKELESLKAELEQASSQIQEKDKSFAAVLKDKQKPLEELRKQGEGLLKQVDENKARVKEILELNERLRERNEKLLVDNKILKKKVNENARKTFRVAVLNNRLVKDSSVAHYNLGVLYSQKQQYEDAVTEFNKVLELKPDDSATHYNLGLIYAEYLNNKAKAISHFKRYIAVAPKDDKDVELAKKYILTWEAWEEENLKLDK